MTLEQSPEGALWVEIQRKSIEVQGTSMCKGPGTETDLPYWRNKEAKVSVPAPTFQVFSELVSCLNDNQLCK